MDIKGAVLTVLAVALVLLTVLGLAAVNPNWETTAGYVAPIVGVIALIAVVAGLAYGRG